MKAFMVIKNIKTHGPMNYFPLRKTIEDETEKTKLSHGLVTIHVKGATPGIVIIDKNELDNIDKALRKLVPVYGWRHGNAYAHLRSTITSTTHTLYFKENKLELPPNHEIYLVETRPVHNHWRTIHLYIRGE